MQEGLHIIHALCMLEQMFHIVYSWHRARRRGADGCSRGVGNYTPPPKKKDCTRNNISFKQVRKADFYIFKPTSALLLLLLFQDSPEREFLKGKEDVLELR